MSQVQVRAPAHRVVAPLCQAAQSGLPRQGDAVERGGDAVGEQLQLGVRQGDVGGEIHAGARLHLAFERVAVDVDDARQHQQASGVEAHAAGWSGRADPVDPPAGNGQVDRLHAIGRQQHLAAGDT